MSGVTERGRGAAAIALLAGLAAWEVASRLGGSPVFPPCSHTLVTAWRLVESGAIVAPLVASLGGLVVGFLIAATAGLVVGALMGVSRTAEHLLDLHVHSLLAAPSLIFVPVLFGLFGVSRTSQVAVVVISAFPVIAVNVTAGVRRADPALVDMARAFGARRVHVLRTVVLPGAAPLVAAGLRLGAGRAVKGMVNGEMMIALSGLGALIRGYGGRFAVEELLGVTAIIVVVALGFTAAASAIGRRVLWRIPPPGCRP